MINRRSFSIVLLIIGSILISFGGLIMRSMNSADSWQIIFYRALGFVLSFTIILLFRYRKNFINIIKKTGFNGFLGGLFYMTANFLFIKSFANTSIGNTLFTISTIPFITAIIAFIFLREKIKIQTIFLIIIAFFGIFIMIKGEVETGDYYGNILALGCALFFSFFILILRKYRNIDMMPVGLIGGIFIVLVSFIVNKGDINISSEDIILCILWGGILNGFMNMVFTFTTRYLLASEVTFFMLLEFCLGPIWVWLFLDESMRTDSIIGGLIVIFCVAIYSSLEIYNYRRLKS